jgi:hypothetical protein
MKMLALRMEESTQSFPAGGLWLLPGLNSLGLACSWIEGCGFCQEKVDFVYLFYAL